MRILLIHNRYQHPGGEDVVFANEARLLRNAGHEVTEYVDDNSRISDLHPLRLGLETIWSKPSYNTLSVLLRDLRPDLAHFHNTFPLISASAYSACKRAGVPVVQTLHNYRLLCPNASFFRDGHVCEECLDHSLLRSLLHRCYRNSAAATATVAAMLTVHRARRTWSEMVDRFIALTQFSRGKFLEGGLPESRLSVKPNFALSDPGEPLAQRQHAFFLGRLSAEKGAATLVAALRLVPQRIAVKVAGEGPLHGELSRFLEENHLSNVALSGALPHAQAMDELRHAYFLIFPSALFENFPLSIVEAFACGVPVIASRLGAMSEIVEDGRTGLHFNPGDSDDLAAKIQWAWEHPAEMARMGQSARAEYEAKYTAERNYSLLMGIYDKVLRGKTFNSIDVRLRQETPAAAN